MDAYSEHGEGSNHRRKRSRDIATEDTDAEKGIAAQPEKAQDPENMAEELSSPKKKRSRDQVDKDEAKREGLAESSEGKDSSDYSPSSQEPAEGEPEKKRHRDDSQERDTVANSKVRFFFSFAGGGLY